MKKYTYRVVSACVSVVVCVAAAYVAVAAEPSLKLTRVTFDPPYLEAGATTKIDVAVKLRSGSGKVQLEEVEPRSRARESTRRVATLRDEGGGVFARAVRFRDPRCGVRRLRVTQTEDGRKAFSPVFELPSASGYLASATLLPTRILELAEANAEVIEIDAVHGR
jgi:hypothetical protein